jgi:uncharacterized glyoxalase superfamily protein PhnB
METRTQTQSGTPLSTTTTLIPHLVCKNAADAAEFYKKALGAELMRIFRMPDGRVMHAALNINGAMFFLVDEFPEHGSLGPNAVGGASVTLHLHVPDCDAVFDRAVAAGCSVRMPLQDMFWGDRYGIVIDPFGHSWSIATTIRTVSDEELQQAMNNMGPCGE